MVEAIKKLPVNEQLPLMTAMSEELVELADVQKEEHKEALKKAEENLVLQRKLNWALHERIHYLEIASTVSHRAIVEVELLTLMEAHHGDRRCDFRGRNATEMMGHWSRCPIVSQDDRKVEVLTRWPPDGQAVVTSDADRVSRALPRLYNILSEKVHGVDVAKYRVSNGQILVMPFQSPAETMAFLTFLNWYRFEFRLVPRFAVEGAEGELAEMEIARP